MNSITGSALTPSIGSLYRRRASLIAAGSLASYRLVMAMVLVAILLAAAIGFGWDRHDLPMMVGVLATIVAIAWWLRWRGAARVATALEAAVLVLAASMATAVLSVLFATTALPYQDAMLIALDRLVLPGFSWRDMFTVLHRQDAIVAAMSRIYASLLWQPFMLVALLALSGRERAAWRFVHGWTVALVLCVVLFPLVPALSPYPYYGITHDQIPAMSVDIGWRQAEVLGPIRTGAMRLISPAAMTGMISYPSFHAAGAVLLLWGFRELPVIAVPFILLDIAMALTAPLIGSHYFIDIVAGVMVAIVAIRVAGRS